MIKEEILGTSTSFFKYNGKSAEGHSETSE